MKRTVIASLLLLAGCHAAPERPLPLADKVDLDRFMGDWYVIASTPTLIDGNAFAAIESYRRDGDGSIATTYTFRDGAFDGPPKRYTPRGFVMDPPRNAVWGMQFVWPIKADYRIAYLAPDYSHVVIAREKRDYAWVMARKPHMEEKLLQELLGFLTRNGYDTSELRRMPQPPQGARP